MHYPATVLLYLTHPYGCALSQAAVARTVIGGVHESAQKFTDPRGTASVAAVERERSWQLPPKPLVTLTISGQRHAHASKSR